MNHPTACRDGSRKTTVADHETFLAGLLTEKDRDELDELDENDADPLIDRAPGRKSKRDTNRVLSILDDIENGRGK